MPDHQPQIVIDPIADSAILGATLGFALIVQGIVGTGEIRPQDPGDPNQLLGIDRGRALSDKNLDNNLSDIAVGSAFVYALTDAVLVQLLDRGDQSLDYGFVYSQSVAITLAAAALAKLAVRRPRPRAYQAARNGTLMPGDTDRALSFFSGHTAVTGSLAATAAYLAWVRPSSSLLERWLVTGIGAALTTFVGTMRVLEGDHFPTDVIAGGLVGVGIGVLVPHLHLSPRLNLTALVDSDGAGLRLAGSF